MKSKLKAATVVGLSVVLAIAYRQLMKKEMDSDIPTELDEKSTQRLEFDCQMETLAANSTRDDSKPQVDEFSSALVHDTPQEPTADVLIEECAKDILESEDDSETAVDNIPLDPSSVESNASPHIEPLEVQEIDLLENYDPSVGKTDDKSDKLPQIELQVEEEYVSEEDCTMVAAETREVIVTVPHTEPNLSKEIEVIASTTEETILAIVDDGKDTYNPPESNVVCKDRNEPVPTETEEQLLPSDPIDESVVVDVVAATKTTVEDNDESDISQISKDETESVFSGMEEHELPRTANHESVVVQVVASLTKDKDEVDISIQDNTQEAEEAIDNTEKPVDPLDEYANSEISNWIYWTGENLELFDTPKIKSIHLNSGSPLSFHVSLKQEFGQVVPRPKTPPPVIKKKPSFPSNKLNYSPPKNISKQISEIIKNFE